MGQISYLPIDMEAKPTSGGMEAQKDPFYKVSDKSVLFDNAPEKEGNIAVVEELFGKPHGVNAVEDGDK